MDLPLDDHRIDQTASVLDDHKPFDCDLTGRKINFDDRHMAGV